MEIDHGRILDALPAMAWTALPDGGINFVNRLWREHTGLGDGCDWLAAFHPDDRSTLDERWRSILASGVAGDMEARVRRFDGDYRWHRIRCSPMRDAAGQVAGWCGVATDIDDLRRAEEALRLRKLDFQSIVDSIPIPVAVTTPTGEVEGLNQLTLDYFGKTFEELKGWKASDVVHPDDIEHTVAAQLEAHQKGSPYSVESRHRRADGVYHWYNVHGLPLRDPQGRILRWLHLLIEIEDRKQAEEAVRESERKARAIVDGIPAGLGVLGPTGEVEAVNKLMLDYLGKSEEEFRDWKTTDIVHPDDLPRVTETRLNAVATGQPYASDQRLRGADGTYRWFQVRGRPLSDADGRIIRWYVVYADIDDRKRAEQALAASDRESRAILDSIPARVGIYDTDGKRVSANRRAIELSGFPADADWRHLYHPDDVEGAEKQWRRCLATEQAFEYEYRARMADGTYRWHLARRVPMRDEGGRTIRWYGISYDIEDRKRAEQALAASERNLQLTLDTIPVTVVIFDADGTYLSSNKRAAELSGLPYLGDWRLVIHPDDLPRADSQWRESLAAEQLFECEYRARLADGTYRWFLGRRVPMRDAAGKVIRWYGIAHDIEDRKRAEQVLATSERNLQLTIDTIPALAWSARLDGSAEFLSQHYLDYVGLSASQAQGWGWAAAVHPDDMEALAATWQEILAAGEPGEAEARLRHRDGAYRWFLFRVNPLRDEHGNIVKWYGVNTDIEDRKRSEESFRAIVETTPECVKVVARDGTVLRTNAAGAAMAGVPTVDAVIGQRFFDFVAPEHREKYRAFHEKICAGQKAFLEFDLINAQGVRRHMETHAAPMRNDDGSIVQLGVTRDMTARKRAEDALRRSEAFLAEGQYLARMGNLSWHVPSGEIIWSEQLHRIYEFEPGSVVTLDRMNGRAHSEDLPLMLDMVERARRGENNFEYQYRIVSPDQSIKHLHLIAHRTGDRADQVEYIGTVLDVTQRRVSEEALEQLRSELAQATRIMSLGALTASIAHEVNQPLAGIVTNAGTCLRMLAADPPNVDGARETARRTIRDGNRAADVIARLRALFAKKAVAMEPLDLNDAVREVIALSWGDLQRKRVVLHSELADGLPAVGGDRIQLQQVIMNLLRNGADAMGAVDDRPRRLLIRTAADQDDQVCLAVQDAGAGFGTEGTEKLFDAFYTTKSDGMGIGLSVSRSIIESHGGRLWAEANDGPGATFSFTIPRHSEGDPPAEAPAVVRAPAGNARNTVVIS